jgi:DNA invertase Pin-like site-specific DNA recombinase
LEDVEANKINVIVVYKVDRLTRSLSDFANIVEALDSRGVSFVSVTQQFNTTPSMGRLTLYIPLSFAQFEREVTGERIRDKIAASNKKGMWVGGLVPLGYDLEARKLVPSSKESEVVCKIFSVHLKVGCVPKLAVQPDRDKIRSKVWTTKTGTRNRAGIEARGGTGPRPPCTLTHGGKRDLLRLFPSDLRITKPISVVAEPFVDDCRISHQGQPAKNRNNSSTDRSKSSTFFPGT